MPYDAAVSSSFCIQHAGGSSTGELRGAERTAVMGGTTRKITLFELRDREVVLDGQLLRRQQVRSVTASAAGPSLVALMADGTELRVDATDHPIADVEWLARRMATILEVRSRAQVVESLDRMTLTLLAPDPVAGFRNALFTHLGILAFVAWLAGGIAIDIGGVAGVVSMSVGVLFAAAQLGDLAMFRNLERAFTAPSAAEVSIAPDGLTVRHQTSGWAQITGVRKAGRELQLTIGEEAYLLSAPDDLASHDLDRAGTAIAAFIDAFHSDEALQHEQSMRAGLTGLKGRGREQA